MQCLMHIEGIRPEEILTYVNKNIVGMCKKC